MVSTLLQRCILVIRYHFPKIHRSVLFKITIIYFIFETFMTSICEKKNSAEVQLIHAEQISLYNFIVLRENNRHSWRLNNWSETFYVNGNLWIFLNWYCDLTATLSQCCVFAGKKNYFHVWNQQPRICPKAMFLAKLPFSLKQKSLI